MTGNQRTALKTDNKNVNWRSTFVSGGVYAIIVGALFSFIYPIYYTSIIRSEQIYNIQPSGREKSIVLLLIVLLFFTLTILCGIIEYIRHKNLKSALTVTLLVWLSGGILAIIGSIILMILVEVLLGVGGPQKTD